MNKNEVIIINLSFDLSKKNPNDFFRDDRWFIILEAT